MIGVARRDLNFSEKACSVFCFEGSVQVAANLAFCVVV